MVFIHCNLRNLLIGFPILTIKNNLTYMYAVANLDLATLLVGLGIVPSQVPRLPHSLEEFAALIPHDEVEQLPVMEVCLCCVCACVSACVCVSVCVC